MSDFNDRPLVVGSINGLRSFKVDTLGRLTGVSHESVWTPGENVAKCDGCSGGYSYGGSIPSRYLSGGYLSIAGFDLTTPYRTRVSIGTTDDGELKAEVKPETEHRIGGLGNQCGFWAYFDGGNDYHSPTDGIAAIVEGYGTVTMGTRGFRAEKAKIAALVIPQPATNAARGRWLRYADWTERHDAFVTPAMFAMVLAGIVVTIAAASMPSPPLLPVGLLALLAGGATIRANIVGFRRELDRKYPSVARNKVPSYDADRVRRNYPDVPVFPTVKAALKAFPVNHPEPPEAITPETADDFWTRSAS